MRITIDGLRQRRDWLKQELAKCEREIEKRMGNEPKPEQQPLPGTPTPPTPPPREKTRHLKAYDFFEGKRRGHLERIGVPHVPEAKPPSAAWITVVFTAIFDAVHDDGSRAAALIDLYFEETWPAKYDVPYNFGAFAKVWRDQLLAKLPHQPEAH